MQISVYPARKPTCNRSLLSRVVICVGLLVGLALAPACTGTQTKTTDTQAKSKFVEQNAAPAPDFQLRDLRGDTHQLKDFRGKVVLLNFWATWCSPCLKELQHFQKMYEVHKKEGLEIVAVSVDEAQTVAQVGPLINRYGYNFRVLLDTEGRVVTQFNPNRHNPFSVLIDRKGNMRMNHQGYTPGDEIEMEKIVKQLLQESAK
ncbi:MAG: TlpA family protein disulfide reductase [Myxococcales bacterium]|nr:TlpA family protein disulfide reductase [Myxococcales bacterium]